MTAATRSLLALAVISASSSLLTTGAAAAANASTDPVAVGSWVKKTQNTGVIPIHMLHYPGDKLLMIERAHYINPVMPGIDPTTNQSFTNSGDGFTQAQYDSHTKGATAQWFQGNLNFNDFLTDSAEYNLGVNNYTLIDRQFPLNESLSKNTGYAFCSGHAQLADGTYAVVGGDQFWNRLFKGVNRTSVGLRDIRVATASNATGPASITKVAMINNPMNYGPDDPNIVNLGRWYPSVVLMPNEDALIIGGQKEYFNPTVASANYPSYEIFHPTTATTEVPVNVTLLQTKFPINLYPVAYVRPQSGDIWMQVYDDVVLLDVTKKTETPAPGLDLTKQNGLMGRNFPFVGTNFIPMMSYRDNYQMNAWFCGGVNTTSPTGQPMPRDGNQWYSNCPTCSGSARCNWIDVEKGTAWADEDMPIARSQPTAVNLPDGTVVLVSGSGTGHQGGVYGQGQATNPVLEAVIFDPSVPKGQTGRWTVAAQAPTGRHYHNSATLLEDGTVVTGGGDSQNGADQLTLCPYDQTLDIFSPPYMAIANRPSFVLPLATTAGSYGQQIVLQFTSAVATTIRQVSLIRYASGTHSTNLDQRHVELQIVKYGSDKLLVTLPPNANVAQPGNWMVWAVDSRGAPVMKAGTINLRASNPATNAVWNEADTVAAPTFGAKPLVGSGGVPPSPQAGSVTKASGAAAAVASSLSLIVGGLGALLFNF
ncbi:hypothetical protein HDU87_001972 [Geranomyces variabilis]|uniref:Glyoxal oxidase n=1 Tax=Geranomyces variabilis TaxID=109894 RepID=A0AAD5TP41_9FUNG|nr:hypothetical protein HDU87_001972 [Geranomyces variabilis]